VLLSPSPFFLILVVLSFKGVWGKGNFMTISAYLCLSIVSQEVCAATCELGDQLEVELCYCHRVLCVSYSSSCSS